MEKQGRYIKVKKIIHHEATPAVEEVSHYVVIREYENGGRDVEKVVDVPGSLAKPAWDEEVEEDTFVEFTEKELTNIRIDELICLLESTDYKAIKFAEGELTEEEYASTRELRRSYRAEINELQEKLSKL